MYGDTTNQEDTTKEKVTNKIGSYLETGLISSEQQHALTSCRRKKQSGMYSKLST